MGNYSRYTEKEQAALDYIDKLTRAPHDITDADFAMETANMSRAQILQQAGTAMLAQANSQPQLVLKLLQ